MNVFGVIGNPIEHSLSPVIHQSFAAQTHVILSYEKILGLEFENQVRDFFSQGGKGLNVTLPFKQNAFSMADKTTKRCQQAGAANTLWMKDGLLWADNTDGIGLVRDLSRFIHLEGKRILILGGGGATRGIIHPLLENQPQELVIAIRDPNKIPILEAEFPKTHCVDLMHLKEEFDLIINATSASLKGDPVVLPAECMANKPFCYDLAYKLDGLTSFIEYAQEIGCEAHDGLGMLVEQAAEAFYIWNGVRPLTGGVLELLRSPHP